MTAPSSRRKWLIAGAVAVAVLVVGLVLLNKAVCFEGSCGPIVVTTTTWTWDGGRWSSGMRQVAVGGSLDYNRENLAFDPATGHLVLVAILPDDSQTQGGATWTWSGSGWTRIHSGTGPDFPGPLVYNGQTRRLLMFTDAGVFAWSGKDWLHEKGSSAPGVGEPLAYDPDVSSVVSVSRNCSGSGTTETSVFRDGAWSTLPGASLPSWGDLVYDAKRSQLVLFGDAWCDPGTPPKTCPAQMWTFDGAKWTRKDVPFTPPVDGGHSNCWSDDTYRMNRMAYDPDSGQVLMLGSQQLWAWDGSSWAGASASLPPGLDSSNAIVAFDERHHALVVISTSVS